MASVVERQGGILTRREELLASFDEHVLTLRILSRRFTGADRLKDLPTAMNPDWRSTQNWYDSLWLFELLGIKVSKYPGILENGAAAEYATPKLFAQRTASTMYSTEERNRTIWYYQCPPLVIPNGPIPLLCRVHRRCSSLCEQLGSRVFCGGPVLQNARVLAHLDPQQLKQPERVVPVLRGPPIWVHRGWQILEAIRTSEVPGEDSQRDDVVIEQRKQLFPSRQYSSLAFDHTGHGAGSSLCTSVDLAIVIIVLLAKVQPRNLVSGIFKCVVQISEFINVDFGCVSAHLRRSGPGLNKRAPEAKMRDDEAIPAASVRDVSGILLDHIFRTFVPLWNILQHVLVVREETCRGHKLSPE